MKITFYDDDFIPLNGDMVIAKLRDSEFSEENVIQMSSTPLKEGDQITICSFGYSKLVNGEERFADQLRCINAFVKDDNNNCLKREMFVRPKGDKCSGSAVVSIILEL